MDKKKKKKFKLFDMNRDGKGVDKGESKNPTFAYFFKSLFRKFPQLLRLNVLMLFQILPIVVIAVVYFTGDKSPTATSTLFAPMFGINQTLSAPTLSQALDMSSIHMGLPLFNPAANWTIVILSVLLLITWGWQNVGATYVLRGLMRGDAVFVFTDFFYGIKRNFKQGFLFGLIDFIICSALVIDFVYFYQLTGQSFGFDFMYFVIFALAIIYFIMRFYIYNLLITFDIKNFKIIKNSFIFSILGIKRNILAFLGIIALVVIHLVVIFFLLPTAFGFTVILPFVYILAVTAYMGTYAAYPIIDRYMIAPYAKNDEEEFVYLKPSDDEENIATENK